MNTTNEGSLCGHEGISQVKQSQSLFPRDFMEDLLQVCPWWWWTYCNERENNKIKQTFWIL